VEKNSLFCGNFWGKFHQKMVGKFRWKVIGFALILQTFLMKKDTNLALLWKMTGVSLCYNNSKRNTEHL